MSIIDVRPGLVAFLYADAAVAAVIEWSVPLQSGGQRIFPIKLPQGVVKPSIVYNRISAQGDHHMQGPSGLTSTRFQIDAWAQTANAAVSLANLVKDRLDGYAGAMGSVAVQGVFFDSEHEDFDDAAKLHRMGRDYIIWYEERV